MKQTNAERLARVKSYNLEDSLEKATIKYIQRNEGITLVVLIITIILLLILLGVGTKTIIDGKLISSAEKAVNETNNRTSKEQTEINGLIGELTEIEQSQCEHEWGEWETIKTVTDKETGKRKRVCSKCGKVFEQDVLILGSYIIGYDPAVGEKGQTIATSYTSKGAVKGGTLEENHTTDGSQGNGCGDQTFTVQSITSWRIIGQDEEGRLLITSTEPINTDESKSYFIGKQAGWLNYIDELNKICGIYGQGKYADKTAIGKITLDDKTTIATGGRSIKGEDIGTVDELEISWTKVKDETEDRYYIYRNGIKTSGRAFVYYDGTTWQIVGDETKPVVTKGTYITQRKYTTLENDMLKKSYWIATKMYDSRYGFFPYAMYTMSGLYSLQISYSSYESYNSPTNYQYGIRPVVYLRADVETTYNSETGEYTIVD